jgi:hypothetical protein
VVLEEQSRTILDGRCGLGINCGASDQSRIFGDKPGCDPRHFPPFVRANVD